MYAFCNRDIRDDESRLRIPKPLYCFCFSVIAIVDNRWKALGPLFAASWALLGIEAASVECERPFAWHSNHLPLGKMCIVISTNVAQTILQFEDFS